MSDDEIRQAVRGLLIMHRPLLCPEHDGDRFEEVAAKIRASESGLDPDGNQYFKVPAAARHKGGGDAAAVLARDAENDRIAWRACSELVAKLSKHGQPIPEPIAGIAVRAMQGEAPRRSRGGDRYRNIMRDGVICNAIYLATLGDGITPYRNETSDGSACDIVADELQAYGVHLSYQAVAKVWQNREKVLSQFPQPDLIDMHANNVRNE